MFGKTLNRLEDIINRFGQYLMFYATVNGMIAENQRCIHRKELPKYGERDFNEECMDFMKTL